MPAGYLFIDYIDSVLGHMLQKVQEDNLDEKQLQNFARRVRNLYVDLFHPRDGILPPEDRLLQLEFLPGEEAENSGEAKRRRPAPKLKRLTCKGKGKGAPGVARKIVVTQRQRRRRAAKDISSPPPTPLPPSSPPPPSTPPMPSSPAPSTPPTTLPPPSSPLSPAPTPVSPEASTCNAVHSVPPTLQQAPLDADQRSVQVNTQLLKAKRIDLFKSLVGNTNREGVALPELDLWYKEMGTWSLLDDTFRVPLRQKWRELRDLSKDCIDSNTALIATFLELGNLANGFANAAAHMTGYLVQEVIQAEEERGTPADRQLDALVSMVNKQSYREYTGILRECNCAQCTSVLAFDAQHHGDTDADERPCHCENVEPWAQSLFRSTRGLSNTSLRKCGYFFSSTPPMSPPTVSTATPTEVQTATVRYMALYLKQYVFHHVPANFEDTSTALPPNEAELVEVPARDVVMFDGDTGHVLITDTTADIVSQHWTHDSVHGRTLRFRTLGNDAPELGTSVSLFHPAHGRQPTCTFDAGVESLRCARSLVAQSSRVLLHFPRNHRGHSMAQRDRYGRLLLNVWLQQIGGDNQLHLLAELLARAGHTLPTIGEGGVDGRIQTAAVDALEDESGMFALPMETYMHPFRPWDVRKTMPSFTEYHAVEESATTFRFAESSLVMEGFVYPAPSSLPDAGHGLFLRPRSKAVKKGSYLCTYAEAWSATRPAYDEAGPYLLEVSHKGKSRFYDAPSFDGVNIGRFANQRGVLVALHDVKRRSNREVFSSMDDHEWKCVNDGLQRQANASFQVRGDMLVLVAAKELPGSQKPIELFVSYGDLRCYWVSGIVRDPGSYPESMVGIVRFLFNSPKSNWSLEQKGRWGDCDDLIDTDGEVAGL